MAVRVPEKSMKTLILQGTLQLHLCEFQPFLSLLLKKKTINSYSYAYMRSLYVSDFIEEDIENQSVTPSKNNTVSVCTPRMGRVFNTPQSIGRNTEEEAFSFLQYQQINLKFGDCCNPWRSLEIDKKNSDAVSDSVDEEQSPDHSPINSFTLTVDDSGENILLEDVTDPGLVDDDDVRNSSEYRELNVLREISQNNLSSRKSSQRLGKKSLSED